MTEAKSDTIGTSPSRIASPRLRFEAQRALVWVSVIGLACLAIYLSQTLLVVFGALVLAAMLDGGARLLGRVLPIKRVFRVLLVLIGIVGFGYWLFTFAGSQISQEASTLTVVLEAQIQRGLEWLEARGYTVPSLALQGTMSTMLSNVGMVTRAIGTVFGGFGTIVLIVIIGIYIAMEPKLYERGVAWMLPRESREAFYHTAARMGATMRRLMAGRLLGMLAEGLFTWVALALYGVPMAALLGILTGLLAFVPNLGALVAGILMVLVGFAGGTEMGIYVLCIYVFVQCFDGYVLIPLIAKKTVDLAPALVLTGQLIMGILFGILGLFLADPLLAMIKVLLERRAERHEDLKLQQEGA